MIASLHLKCLTEQKGPYEDKRLRDTKNETFRQTLSCLHYMSSSNHVIVRLVLTLLGNEWSSPWTSLTLRTEMKTYWHWLGTFRAPHCSSNRGQPFCFEILTHLFPKTFSWGTLLTDDEEGACVPLRREKVFTHVLGNTGHFFFFFLS